MSLTTLFCRIVGHFWRDTHANRYGIATRQECRCGAVREWHGGPGGKWHTPPPRCTRTRRARVSEQLLTRAEVERRTGFRKSAIYARIAAGTFPAPKPDPDGGASVRWLASEVDAWVNRWGGTVVGTGEPGEAKAA